MKTPTPAGTGMGGATAGESARMKTLAHPTTPVKDDDGDELEALAHERIAEGHALLARAARMRQHAPRADRRIPISSTTPRAHVDDYGVTHRRVLDAIRSGELPASDTRPRTVRASDLAAWLAARTVRRPTKLVLAPDLEDADEFRRIAEGRS